MNSCSSSSLSACAPPLITFMSGTGRTCAFGPPSARYSGKPSESAAACATASETPSVAFAPRFDLSARAVELEHAPVDLALVERVEPDERGPDDLRDVRDRPEHALAAEALRVLVPQLDGLVLAGRGPARDGGASEGTVDERHVDLDGRVAARIEDLARLNGLDEGHGAHILRPVAVRTEHLSVR